MSTEFLTLKECIEAQKGSFIGVVIKESALSAGSKDGSDWTKKTYTIQDTTANIDLVAWNEDVNKIKVGCKYEFVGLWWKEYKGTVQLSFGNYAQVKLIGTEPIPTKDVSQQVIDSVESIKDVKLPPISESAAEFVENEVLFLLQLEQKARETILKHYPKLSEVNPQKLGMIVKEIYRESKKSNFTRATNLGDGFTD